MARSARRGRIPFKKKDRVKILYSAKEIRALAKKHTAAAKLLKSKKKNQQYRITLRKRAVATRAIRQKHTYEVMQTGAHTVTIEVGGVEVALRIKDAGKKIKIKKVKET